MPTPVNQNLGRLSRHTYFCMFLVQKMYSDYRQINTAVLSPMPAQPDWFSAFNLTQDSPITDFALPYSVKTALVVLPFVAGAISQQAIPAIMKRLQRTVGPIEQTDAAPEPREEDLEAAPQPQHKDGQTLQEPLLETPDQDANRHETKRNIDFQITRTSLATVFALVAAASPTIALYAGADRATVVQTEKTAATDFFLFLMRQGMAHGFADFITTMKYDPKLIGWLSFGTATAISLNLGPLFMMSEIELENYQFIKNLAMLLTPGGMMAFSAAFPPVFAMTKVPTIARAARDMLKKNPQREKLRAPVSAIVVANIVANVLLNGIIPNLFPMFDQSETGEAYGNIQSMFSIQLGIILLATLAGALGHAATRSCSSTAANTDDNQPRSTRCCMK